MSLTCSEQTTKPDPPGNWLSQVRKNYQSTGEPIRWPIPTELEVALAVTLRDRFATELASKTAEEVALRYVYLRPAEMASMVRLAERWLLPRPLEGVGLELGAGCGVLASVVAKKPAVEAVLAVEVCESVVELLIPKIAREILGSGSHKVLPVVGSFNDLRLPSESVDFAVENDSLHHSDDLPLTMSECARVLRPGGVLLCFDRCHPDSLSDAEVNRMLANVYSPEFLAANGYPQNMKLTRGENGEHEYRLFEWREAADMAGFRLIAKKDLLKREPAKKAFKGALAVLPLPLRRRLYKTDNSTLANTMTWAKQTAQRLTLNLGRTAAIFAPKKTTVLVFQKPYLTPRKNDFRPAGIFRAGKPR